MAKSMKKPAVTPKAAAKPRKPSSKKLLTMAKVTPIAISHEKVAELAHHFWNERGQLHGYDEEDWFRAEQELRGKAS